MQKDFYVYQFLRETSSEYGDTGTPYYIGKGRGKRAYQTWRVIPRPINRSMVDIICSDLSEKDALQIEMLFVHLYGRIDLGTGCLRNLTDGGEGTTGYKATEKTKALLSSIRRGRVSNRKGSTASEETRKKMRDSHKGLKMPPGTGQLISKAVAGRIRSLEHSQNISKAKKGVPGKPWTEEQKIKMRESMRIVHASGRGRWAKKPTPSAAIN